MDLPKGSHWLDWYLSALNGETEHEDWKAKREARLAKSGGSGIR